MNIIYKNITTEQVDENLYTEKKIAMHLHVFYIDLLPEFCKFLKLIPVEFDAYISIPDTIACDDKTIMQILHPVPRLRQISILHTPNRGRDIAPMICTYGRQLLEYDIILHMHTKRSPHNKEFDNWRPFMLEHILHSEECIKSILALLSNNVGIVCARDFILDASDDRWGKNKAIAKSLVKTCNLNIDIDKDYSNTDFPVGTFFWAKKEAVTQLLTLPLKYEDFPPEPIKTDGTLAHALERMIFIFSDSQSYKNVKLYFINSHYEDIQGVHGLVYRNAKHIKIMQRLIYLSIFLFIALCLSILFNIWA